MQQSAQMENSSNSASNQLMLRLITSPPAPSNEHEEDMID